MNFKERREVKAEVSFTGGEPLIYVAPIALDKMAWYVQGCDKEIGWLGRVERQDNIFLIHDVYLFKQEVHATTCEINPEGLADFVTELFTNDTENAMEIVNNLRLWGHSHVNMTVSPSGQDDTQVNTFKDANPWFIRVIANKAGEMEFSIYDFEQGIKFKNVRWVEYRTNQVALEEAIKAEIKEKVTTKNYATTTYGGNKGGKNWVYVDGKWTTVEPKKKEKVVELGKPKRTSNVLDDDNQTSLLWTRENGFYTQVQRDAKGEVPEDFIIKNFTLEELKSIAECYTIIEARTFIETVDFANEYGGLDIMNIMDCAQNIYPQ